MSWLKLLGLISGAATAASSLLSDNVPPAVGVIGGLAAGASLAIKKRQKGSQPFDTAGARTKVDRMFPEGK